MKKPTHKRKSGNTKRIASGIVLSAHIIESAKYEPSQKHKTHPILGQEPYHDTTAAKCSNDISIEMAQNWLSEALNIGCFSEAFTGDFPKIIWFKFDSVVYEAKQSGFGSNLFHGFPLEEYEWPNGINKFYPNEQV